MALQDVSAKTKVTNEDGTTNELEGTIQYDFGNDLKDAVDKFGEEIVFSLYAAQAKIQCQGAMRKTMVDGGDVSQVAKLWIPGTSLEKKADPVAAAKLFFANASAEEKAEFIKMTQ